MHAEGEAVAGPGANLAVDLVERLGVIAKRADRLRDVDAERVLDRLTDIEALEHGERLGIALHQVGEREQHVLLVAVMQVAPAPILEGAPAGAHRGIDILDSAFGNAVDQRAVARRQIVEALAGNARLQAAVDHRKMRHLDCVRDLLEMGQ